MKKALLFTSISFVCLGLCFTPTYAVTKKKPLSSKPKKTQKEEPVEDTSITLETHPEVIYRMALLSPRMDSALHRDVHKNYLDQLFLTLNMRMNQSYFDTAVFEPTVRTKRDNPTVAPELIIDQGFVETSMTKGLTLTAGKKAENHGSGFLLNPSDLLNQDKDFFDPLYQEEGKGKYFSRITAHTGDHSLGLGFIPLRGQHIQEGKGWLIGKTLLFNTDIVSQIIYDGNDKQTYGLNLSYGLSLSRFIVQDRWEFHLEGRYQGRQVETPTQTYSSYELTDKSVMLLGGTRWVLASKRTVILEGYYNQSGLLPEELQAYYAAMRKEDETGDKRKLPTKLLGKRYGFFSYQDGRLFQKAELSFSSVYQLQDQSVFASAGVKYFFSPLVTAEIVPGVFQGSVDSEFGEMPFSGSVYFIFSARN